MSFSTVTQDLDLDYGESLMLRVLTSHLLPTQIPDREASHLQLCQVADLFWYAVKLKLAQVQAARALGQAELHHEPPISRTSLGCTQ